MEYTPGELWDDENACYFEGTVEEKEEFEMNKFKKGAVFDDDDHKKGKN